MTTMIRLGPALAGSTPFFKGPDGVGFDGQAGRMVDYGHCFDHQRGYRVFAKFADSDTCNTWGPESLLRWCDGFEAADDEQVKLKAICRQQARQCITLNAEWRRLGRPRGGVPTEPKGSA